jgi:hypothetical protein
MAHKTTRAGQQATVGWGGGPRFCTSITTGQPRVATRGAGFTKVVRDDTS